MNNNNSREIKITDDDDANVEYEQEVSQNDSAEKMNNKHIEKEATECGEGNEYLEQLQRLQAEFMNFKKRIEKERLELSDLFKSELAGSLLPVIDDFERMLDHSNHENNEFLTGVKLIYQKLTDILKEQGLKTIHAKGKKFDPRMHEAVIVEKSENGEDEVVAEELRKGYLFNNRLLRPAQVKVLKSEKVDENELCPKETITTY